MKKFFILFILLLVLFINPINTAVAEENSFYRVIDEETPFFSDPTCTNLLFFLPYTYYVKVLSENNGICHIECYGNYNTIDGYTYKDKLFLDGLTVINPYLNKTIKTVDVAVLFKDGEKQSTSQYVFKDREMFYFGKYISSSNNIMYYVSYNGKLGYVEEDKILPFSISLQENELTFIKTPEEEVTPTITKEENKNGLTGLKTVIIILLSFAGILALFIIVKPKAKFNRKTSYYDENDYE